MPAHWLLHPFPMPWTCAEMESATQFHAGLFDNPLLLYMMIIPEAVSTTLATSSGFVHIRAASVLSSLAFSSPTGYLSSRVSRTLLVNFSWPRLLTYAYLELEEVPVESAWLRSWSCASCWRPELAGAAGAALV